jgi:DNA-binding transcriptional regulator YhcF (GntR family)
MRATCDAGRPACRGSLLGREPPPPPLIPRAIPAVARLPPARHLAAVMHVNTNTVLRALRLLRDDGLLELRPGHGIRVSGTPQRSALLTRAIELVQLGRDSGYSRAELLEIIEQLP